VNQIPEGAFIAAVRVCRVKIDLALTADRTEVKLIERKFVDERRAALAAEEFRLDWAGTGKTGGTDWNAGNVSEGLAAEPAFIREDQVEGARSKELNPAEGLDS
jgi:hypothetical protein